MKSVTIVDVVNEGTFEKEKVGLPLVGTCT